MSAVDDASQKAVDLGRARANGAISPDRLVIVYDDAATSPSHPARVAARLQANGELLQADADIARDVIRVSNGDADAVARHLKGLPGVRDAYPDRVASIDFTPNDPLFPNQYGLTKIQAPPAWDSSQGAGVKVAILDCGIHALGTSSSSHPDLSGKVLLAQNFSSSSTTDDLCNHGTHVAGTVSAITNNGIGVASVAPSTTLINGKVLDDTGSGFFSDIDSGIEWAADNGAKVINMSLGGNQTCPSGTQTAANYAWGKGAVLVAAAGNAGSAGASAPANCLNVIGVAATDSTDTKASFSNWGSGVDLAAPGVNIWSTVNPDINGGKLYRGDFSGTSMATPHVSGVAALVWATSFGTSPSAVQTQLFNTADHISGTGTYWTYGRINAAAAVGGSNTTNYTLSITRTGTGTVTSSPSGINCGSSCSASYSGGTVVSLTPTAASGWSFAGWGGACGGTPRTSPCSVTMSSDRSVSATFKPNADLSITKVGPASAVHGTPYSYTLTATNNGPNSANAVKVTDTLPLSLTFDSVVTTTGTCSTATTSTGNTRVTCSLGTMASGAAATVTITVTPTVASTVNNTGQISSNSTTFDPNTANNKSKVTTTVS